MKRILQSNQTDPNLIQSTLNLFKGVLIEKTNNRRKLNKRLFNMMIINGFMLDPKIINFYSEDDLEKLIHQVIKTIGINGEKLNSTFHKSWAKVKNTPIEQLILEQWFHYFTTYGMEYLGLYDKDFVFIPNEILEIPKLKNVEKLTLIYIRGYTEFELATKIKTVLYSGIALKKETINDLISLVINIKTARNELDIEKVKNKEAKIMLCDEFKIVPANPVEALRYIIYKCTGETLLIKNRNLIEKIKQADPNISLNLFDRLDKKRMAEIFYRFKPLFLAFKRQETKHQVNRKINNRVNCIRRSACSYHSPMPEDFLNSVTAKINKKKKISIDILKSELSKVNIFRKIRLASSLNYRSLYPDSIVYKIRNGKSFSTNLDLPDRKDKYSEYLMIVLKEISEDLNVKGKKIYLPSNIEYTLPSTEKQFTEMIPPGSCINIEGNLIVGIHWENTKNDRVDLDLSLTSLFEKIGWDSYYRFDSNNKSVLFSGDITDAPNGATECFFLQKGIDQPYVLAINYYNRNSQSQEIPFQLFFSGEKGIVNLKKNHMVDPNNIKAVVNSTVKDIQKGLGIIIPYEKGFKFYFSESDIGNQRSIKADKEYTKNYINYLLTYTSNIIKLKQVLLLAGAKFIKDREEADIDLSLEVIGKDTFIELLTKN
jgi:hypothetical protein